MRDRRPLAGCEKEQPRPTRPDVPGVSGEYRRPAAPGRYGTVHMRAVRMLDDELDFEAAEDDLDIPLLDETPRPVPHEPSVLDSSAIRRKSSAGIPAVHRSSGAMNAVDPHAVYVAFAKFGDPPATIWKSPAYALHVLRRKRTLERELEGARRRRSPDVALYEAALRTADVASVRAGIAVICAAVSLVTVLGIALFQVVRGALLL